MSAVRVASTARASRLVVQAPGAADGAAAFADFLELGALRSADRDCSMQDLGRAMQAFGVPDDEWLSVPRRRRQEEREGCQEAAVSEVRERSSHAPSGYPFRLDDQAVVATMRADRSAYVFLLLLSHYGKDAGPRGTYGERLFEDLCQEASRSYIGGREELGQAVGFGAPRRALPSGLSAALSALCSRTNDGLPKEDRRDSSSDKDGSVDIVAWRDFPDRRRGKLLAFGQCYTGRDGLLAKAKEMEPREFCNTFFREQPAVEPVKFYFVPHRPLQDEWIRLCRAGGILFDRCRIAHHAGGVNPELRKDIAAWSGHVLRRIRPRRR